jgi:hypothetical protein
MWAVAPKRKEGRKEVTSSVLNPIINPKLACSHYKSRENIIYTQSSALVLTKNLLKYSVMNLNTSGHTNKCFITTTQ